MKESKTVARVAMEGFSARVFVMCVKFAGRLFKFMTRSLITEEADERGGGKRSDCLAVFFFLHLRPGF